MDSRLSGSTGRASKCIEECHGRLSRGGERFRHMLELKACIACRLLYRYPLSPVFSKILDMFMPPLGDVSFGVSKYIAPLQSIRSGFTSIKCSSCPKICTCTLALLASWLSSCLILDFSIRVRSSIAYPYLLLITDSKRTPLIIDPHVNTHAQDRSYYWYHRSRW